MSRLIDADVLIHDITKLYCEDCEKRKGIKNGKLKFVYEIGDAPCRACGLDGLEDVIKNAPTVDAEPVVRCKNCHYAKPFNKIWQLPIKDTLVCIHFENDEVDEDFFCGCAIKRLEE